MRKALIIGASSGIGRELALQLSAKGYELGLVARRQELLISLQQELPNRSWIKEVDIQQVDSAIPKIHELIEEMKDLDLVILCSGTGHLNSKLDWELELDTIKTNVIGCCALAGLAMKHFLAKGEGHLVIISSIGAIRGNYAAPAYNASKAFLSNYAQGMRKMAFKAGKPIIVTDVKPGFVDTAMAKGLGKFWVAPAPIAAKQIIAAIDRKASHVYVTRRWRLVAWLLKLIPDSAYHRL